MLFCLPNYLRQILTVNRTCGGMNEKHLNNYFIYLVKHPEKLAKSLNIRISLLDPMNSFKVNYIKYCGRVGEFTEMLIARCGKAHAHCITWGK